MVRFAASISFCFFILLFLVLRKHNASTHISPSPARPPITLAMIIPRSSDDNPDPELAVLDADGDPTVLEIEAVDPDEVVEVGTVTAANIEVEVKKFAVVVTPWLGFPCPAAPAPPLPPGPP